MIQDNLEPSISSESNYIEILKKLDGINIGDPLDLNDGFFVSNKVKYIYILTMLSGKNRNKLLEIHDSLYENDLRAAKWYETIKNIITSDSTPHELEQKALENLDLLYEHCLCEDLLKR